MQYLVYVAELFIALLILRALLYNLYLWQIKDYRFDRMKAHFEDVGKWYQLWLIRKTFMPKWTKKMYALWCSFVLIGILYFALFGVSLGAVIILFGVTPVIIFDLILLVNIPTAFVKEKHYRDAREKIKKSEKLLTIGVTGSYGKTSMKTFLSAILAKKFNTLVTPVHVNTEIGIADFILNNLKSDTQILIAEMGAYQRGEIKTMCDFVKPKIGILTGINEQHMALMGSLENIKKAKFELIESLPEKSRMAFYNGDNENTLDVMKKYKGNKTSYSTEELDSFEESLDGIKFSYRKTEFKSKSLGKFNALNLLGAIKVAEYLGVKDVDIKKAVSEVESPAETMKAEKSKSGRHIINDAYNANPTGVWEAFDFVDRVGTDRKILVMSEMLELGKASKDVYKKTIKKAQRIFDHIIFVSPLYGKFATDKSKIDIMLDPEQIKERLDKIVDGKALILLERVKNPKVIEVIRDL